MSLDVYETTTLKRQYLISLEFDGSMFMSLYVYKSMSLEVYESISLDMSYVLRLIVLRLIVLSLTVLFPFSPVSLQSCSFFIKPATKSCASFRAVSKS